MGAIQSLLVPGKTVRDGIVVNIFLSLGLLNMNSWNLLFPSLFSLIFRDFSTHCNYLKSKEVESVGWRICICFWLVFAHKLLNSILRRLSKIDIRKSKKTVLETIEWTFVISHCFHPFWYMWSWLTMNFYQFVNSLFWK